MRHPPIDNAYSSVMKGRMCTLTRSSEAVLEMKIDPIRAKILGSPENKFFKNTLTSLLAVNIYTTCGATFPSRLNDDTKEY